MESKEWQFFGYDESNHGLYPEVCVLCASNNLVDVIPVFQTNQDGSIKILDGNKPEPLLGKMRYDHSNLEARIKGRDYSFLLFNYEDRERLFDSEKEVDYGYKKLGLIIASLLYEKRVKMPLGIYIDGEWDKKKIDYAVDLISDLKSVSKDLIKVFYGAKLDRIFELVNISDELAHSFLPELTFSSLRNHEKRVGLRLNELL